MVQRYSGMLKKANSNPINLLLKARNYALRYSICGFFSIFDIVN